MYTATTRAIRVVVTPQHLLDQTDPAKSQYVWSYQVRIENRGDVAVQLRSRHWKITDGLGRKQEVKGPGVVGQQPVLRPGEHFEYTSGCVLETPRGNMRGSYQMQASGGGFDAEIASFELAMPYSLN